MEVENVLQVLRMPDAPNAYYHRECYAWDGQELVLRVLRLIHDDICAACAMSLCGSPIVQLSLFDVA